MGYPGRHRIYESTIRRMVKQSLDAQEAAFCQAHENDGDETLLQYLRQEADRLHRSPWPLEIPGSSLIEQRFGSWEQALALCGLPLPSGSGRKTDLPRIREEILRQQELYRRKKAAKKQAPSDLPK